MCFLCQVGFVFVSVRKLIRRPVVFAEVVEIDAFFDESFFSSISLQ